MAEIRHGGRLGTPGGHSNNARQARIPEGETLSFANLDYGTPLLLGAPTSFWAQTYSFGRGRGHHGCPHSQPSETGQAISGGNHVSMQPCSQGGEVPLLFTFTLPVRDQRKGFSPGMDRGPLVLLAVDDPRKNFQGLASQHDAFSLWSPPGELCWSIDRERLTHHRNYNPEPSAGI